MKKYKRFQRITNDIILMKNRTIDNFEIGQRIILSDKITALDCYNMSLLDDTGNGVYLHLEKEPEKEPIVAEQVEKSHGGCVK